MINTAIAKQRLIFLNGLFFLLINVPVNLKAQEKSGIQWVEGLSWEQVKAKAKEENKFIFVDIYASWCMPCKKMDKDVYLNDRVGEIINKQFVSVKVQMDTTSHDNINVRNWYGDAQLLKKQYSIDGFPNFLFFTAEGKLMHQAMGLQTIDKFIELAKEALNDPIGRYEHKLALFNKGGLDFSEMPEFAKVAKKRKQIDLSIKVAREYKEKYLDFLTDNLAFTKENLSFVSEFAIDILNSADRYFRYMFLQHTQADSIINRKVNGEIQKISEKVIADVIRREEITEVVYKDGVPITQPAPKWNKIRGAILDKYGAYYCDKLLPENQIIYYAIAKDWKKFSKSVVKKIGIFPPKPGGYSFGEQFGDSWMLNHCAWVLFLYCNNKRVLKDAIGWVDLAIQIESPSHVNTIANYYDTKGNLLYKIGKKGKAMIVQEKALSMTNSNKSILENLEKMKLGKVTWPVVDRNKIK